MVIKGETIGSIMEWHEKTFPTATLSGQKAKWNEEEHEFFTAKRKRDRLDELADMYIVACGIRRWDVRKSEDLFRFIRALADDKGIDTFDVWQAVGRKMKKNRKRVWKPTPEGAWHHVDLPEEVIAELERTSRFQHNQETTED